ncbi:hypothetical protein J4573_51980 [Actinomadura barringtoniae]|uniref:Secreted protein n=1 Tax=Actinomadura barringtoniae TaxID=1427535 RepID=A0A939T743_9ACTN|nr:hypothetical protein [Actinomadura barringtoniae]MBO2455676.1 hypothetical protein [Actinomadura barringtoniae]
MINVMKVAGFAAVVSLGLAGCSSGSDPKAADGSPTTSASAATTAPVAAPASGATAPGNGTKGTAKQGGAVNLTVSSELRRLLGDVYYAATKKEAKDNASGIRRDKVIGPEQVSYGKIVGSTPAKDVFYAMGSTGYSDDPASRQDGPHVWRKRGASWEYLGDTGGAFCSKVPAALVKVWGKACS